MWKQRGGSLEHGVAVFTDDLASSSYRVFKGLADSATFAKVGGVPRSEPSGRREDRTLMRATSAMVLLAGLLGGAPKSLASDHRDGPAARADPSTDITDLFAWMSQDGKAVELVVNVFPSASGGSSFSTAAQYAFHVASLPAFGASATGTTDIICTFDSTRKVSCWIGTADYVTGDASVASGITSASGKVRVFTGLRDDPAFFNLEGFRQMTQQFKQDASGYSRDAASCPAVNTSAAAGYLRMLSHASNGGAAQDVFAQTNVLSIVLSVDKSLLLKGSDPVLSVWASTRRSP
jgi:hypothetical protein